jgi:membrane-bound serine protease (ClpP class)
MDETTSEKAASDVAAYARSLASRRGRNVDLAENAVVESQSFTETEAIEADPKLIDLVASDLDRLLEQLDGWEVRRWDGETETLETTDAVVREVEMTWRQNLLSAIAHPQVSVLLFSLGSLGLTIELWNPGAIIPGVVGAVCLLLAFFAFQILPINYVALLLIVFGLALLMAEMMTPTYGFLAVGGIVSMVLGAVMLVDSPAPELQLGWGFIASTVAGLAVITMLLAKMGISAQLAPPVSGRAGMINTIGETLSSISPGTYGRVSTHGEIWEAKSDEEIAEGEAVRIVAVDGLRLTVRREGTHPSGGSHS